MENLKNRIEQLIESSNYDQAAKELCKALNLKIKVSFLKHDKHFTDDTESRDIYKVEMSRNGRKYDFNFGQSIVCSGEYQVRKELQNKIWCKQTTGGKICLNSAEFKALKWMAGIEKDILKNPNFKAPNEYDILSCLQKYDVGTFDDFCGEFGYNNDSIKAQKVYKAVCDEFQNIERLLNHDEIEVLQLIA